MSNIPTAHIGCDDASLIAKTVLMPGDPLRAKYIAENFLTDVVMFNKTRNIFGYTGKYNGKKISVMASGMGMPSIGIYSYELFKFYDVDTIVRIGSAGSYDENYHVYDTVLATDAYSESNYAKVAFGMRGHTLKGNKSVNNKLNKAAEKLGIELKNARVHSSDVFYGTDTELWKKAHDNGCMCVEMEAFALFANAKELGKKAACLLTISNSFVSDEDTTAEEREKNLLNMIKIALELAK